MILLRRLAFFRCLQKKEEDSVHLQSSLPIVVCTCSESIREIVDVVIYC